MRLRSFRRDERGAAAVEFALVLPILVVLVFGIVDFGRALFAYNYLTAAVREGGRLAAVQKEIASQAIVAPAMVTYLDHIDRLGLPEVTADMITVTPGPLDAYVTVGITGYSFRAITPIPALLGISGDFTFAPSAVFRWERAGS